MVKFKVDWVDGDYEGDEIVVMPDTSISLSQFVEKLHSKLKIELI